jgi:hypothetical protein
MVEHTGLIQNESRDMINLFIEQYANLIGQCCEFIQSLCYFHHRKIGSQRYLFAIVLIDGNEKKQIYINMWNEMHRMREFKMKNFYQKEKNILDLSDEIIFIILKKLNTIDVLHSIVDVNQRFHRLALDSCYIRDLNMTSIMPIDSLSDQISSKDTQLISRICQKILPHIHYHVHKLTVEQDSMKQILLATNYPQLYSLSLINFRKDILYQYLTGMTFIFIRLN